MQPVFTSVLPPDLPVHLRWRTIRVAPGTKASLMLAGPPVGVSTHYTGARTVPCLKRLPGCRLECPLCNRTLRYSVYVPLIDLLAKRQRQIVIQGAKRTLESLSPFAAGDLVACLRGSQDRSTALFTSSRIAPHGVDLRPYQAQLPHDITRYLLHLWQWRELTEHFGETYYPSSRSLDIVSGTRRLADDPPREPEGE